VEIAAAGVVLARLQATPRDIEDLAAGFVFAEGIVEDAGAIGAVTAAPDLSRVDVELPGADPAALRDRSRQTALASGCGGAHFASEIRRRAADAARPATASPSGDEILAAVRELEGSGELFRSTGCAHGAALWRDGACLAFREDIGRHNAADKAAGAVGRAGGDTRGCLLVTTGRLTADIAAKGVRLGVWGIASRSAATDRAVELAAGFGMVLAGFVRGGRFNVYCGANRLGQGGRA